MYEKPSWLDARYAWQNSENAALARLRCWADGELPRRFPCVTSTLPGHSLVLGYAGMPDGLSHVLPFLEHQRDADNASRVRRERTTVSWADLRRCTGLPGCDLLAVGATVRRVAKLRDRRAIVLPFRLHLVVPVVADPSQMRQRISRKERQHAARQFRAKGWVLEASTSAADFDHFFDAIHTPTMRTRHGSATRSMDKDMARECLLRHGVLLMLRERGTHIAGMLCRYGPGDGSLTLRLTGVLDGAQEYYDEGALAAMYVALLGWASEQGVRRLDLSGCEPFLSKGIFQFKRKLRPQVELARTHFRDKRLALLVRRDTPAVRDFLVANPVIAEAPGGQGTWHALYFRDADRPPRSDLQWRCPNITAAREVDLDAFLGGRELCVSGS